MSQSAENIHRQTALNYLATRGDLDMNRVGLFGQGSGGAIATLAAAADPRIKALDVMDPWGDWPVWLRESKQVPEQERAAYLDPSFLDSVNSLDPVTYLPRCCHFLRYRLSLPARLPFLTTMHNDSAREGTGHIGTSPSYASSVST